MIIKLLESLGRKRTILDRNNESVYMERYYLLFGQSTSARKWFPFNVLLHHICRSDEDELHDHPWVSASFILKGGYWEITPEGRFWRSRFSFRVRSATALHRIEIDKDKARGETWTLFFVGPRVRDWGFINKTGDWVQWEKYLSQ